jgi:hypothetical protein
MRRLDEVSKQRLAVQVSAQRLSPKFLTYRYGGNTPPLWITAPERGNLRITPPSPSAFPHSSVFAEMSFLWFRVRKPDGNWDSYAWGMGSPK